MYSFRDLLEFKGIVYLLLFLVLLFKILALSILLIPLLLRLFNFWCEFLSLEDKVPVVVADESKFDFILLEVWSSS